MTKPFRFGVSGGALTDIHEFVALAERAEALGYASISMSDHLDDGLAPLVALTAAAGATDTIRLTTLVLANDFRNPVVLAKELATLDVLSGGRVDWGIGAGWQTSDYERTGIPLDPPGTRITRLAESVAVMRRCFAGDAYSHDGEHYRVQGHVGRPTPTQRPHPPLLLAGGGARVLRLAGREADIVGINFSLAGGAFDVAAGATGTAEMTDAKIDAIRAGAGDRFDDVELQTRVHFVMETDDRDGTMAALAPGFGRTPEDAATMPHALVGTVDDMCASIRSWRERWGLSYVTWSADALETMAPVVERLSGVR
ncbi:MAG: TIGR03621 family F420-dependent LLM class oxidoreductase [Acidimicrobiales bacterium]|nr:TIGR03621 family F420-dependent LLM class oxidoreductase [Acidimicrobiales bacterium]